MNRITKSVSAAALTLATILSAQSVSAQDPVELNVQSAWPLTLPASGRDAQHFADTLNTASGGSVNVKLYSAGKLVPSLEIFDAVQRGTLDAGYTSPLYVAGKFPAVQLFGGVPFGPDAIEYIGWIHNGGGLELWREIYGKQGVMTIPCGLMEPESGGWYKKQINSVDDLKGLKLRFAGLAGQVMKNMGASVVLLSGGDIFPNLERGVIDGTEFSMPAIDKIIGFEKVAKHYYLPGWHQPAAINELIINKAKWDAMSDAQRAMIELSCRDTMMWGTTSTYRENAEAIESFKANGVEVHQFSPEMLAAFEEMTGEVMKEQSAKDEDFNRVWTSLSEYRKGNEAWSGARSN